LKNEFYISYLKSASLGYLQSLQKEESIYKEAVLAFNPSFSSDGSIPDEEADNVRAGLSQLSGTVEELAFIKSKMEGTYFEQTNATESNFKNAIQDSRFSICHIAMRLLIYPYSQILLSSVHAILDLGISKKARASILLVSHLPERVVIT